MALIHRGDSGHLYHDVRAVCLASAVVPPPSFPPCHQAVGSVAVGVPQQPSSAGVSTSLDSPDLVATDQTRMSPDP